MKEYTYPESLRVHPNITEQEPYVTCNPKATCRAASVNRGVRVGVDLEDGICSYCKYRCVHTTSSFLNLYFSPLVANYVEAIVLGPENFRKFAL